MIIPKPIHSSIKKIQKDSEVFQSTPNKAPTLASPLGSPHTPIIPKYATDEAKDSKSSSKLHQGKPHDNTVADESCQSTSTPKIDLAAKNTESEESTSRMLNPLVNKLPLVNPHNNTDESSSSEKSQVPHVLGF